MKQIEIGKVVKLSTTFLRSIGCLHPNAEDKGKVIAITDGWLATVEWSKKDGDFSSYNVKNLVLLDEVAAEARKVEHKDALPGLVIGSNAFLKL